VPVLILCVGNPDRGDDAAGVLVAERLNALGIPALLAEPSSLMEAWAGAARVILVDAVVTGAPVGTIHSWDASHDPLPRGPFRSSTHALGVAEAVELARALGTLPERLVIYGIEAAQFQLGAQPTKAVLEAVDELTGRLSPPCNDSA
jgi:hydrogenase maturation protease